MAKTKEERQANREKRRMRRKMRKEKFNGLIEMVNQTPDLSDDDFLQNPKEKFEKLWPVLQAVLDFAVVLKVTGKKVDKVLIRIIDIGSRMYEGTDEEGESDEFMEKMQQIWGVTRKALTITTVFTDDKTDEIIEKALSIGDWVSSVDEDEED